MEKLHVLVTIPLEKARLDSISAVDPRVEVRYAVEEWRAERGMPATARLALYRHMAQPELTQEAATKALTSMLADTDVIFAWRLPGNLLPRAPRLKWVHATSAGVDSITRGSGLLQTTIILTGSSGVRSTSVAEFAVCLMVMLAKNAPRLLVSQKAHEWKPSLPMKLSGKTLGVVGLGSIGSEIARIAKGFNMKVLAIRRSAVERQRDIAGVDEVFPPGQLLQMLPLCDFVALSTPLTTQTRGLIGEAELRAMKPSAYLVNTARGPVVKQDVLVRALKEGWIAGAGLDVFETEPLPADSELWDLPNVIVTPHNAGFGEGDDIITTELFCENLRRFLAGRDLLNVFDREREY